MNLYGYSGRILLVDLSKGTSNELSTADYAEKFIGGRGIGVKLFSELVPPDTRAFDPENCLVCATGPVTGFFGLAGCRWILCGKSPSRTPEMFSYGNLGGKWGSSLKSAGYDAFAVTGKSATPVYLYIHDGKTEIKDASHVWGLKTFDTQDKLTTELGKNVSVLSVGPAAENMVVFATALADHGASASGGMGSIMGSKNLKAVVVGVGCFRSFISRDNYRLEILGAHYASHTAGGGSSVVGQGCGKDHHVLGGRPNGQRPGIFPESSDQF